MVTLINRPLGHKLTDQDITADVYDSSGEALFITQFAHGLVDGDYVYIQSNIESYNGYKYVDSIAYNEFKLKESATGDYVPFKQQVEVNYRISVLQHGWLAISQPIVYELESNLWPNNLPEEAYTARVVDSQADAEGYTQLNLSFALNSPFALDFIELVGTGPLAGAYQIITVLQPWSIIINLAYSASNNFTGYEVVKYYNNYCINVDVYSGLGTEHPWYSEKPYTLLATLKFTPDSVGRVKFSISDILKGYINTRNNLTLDTLPNNLDFMTAFYIAYSESYDTSNGTEITTFESSVTSDLANFEGHAVNADMPFKSVYISHMSEYINEDTYLAKWLILQDNPIAIVGYFFDISFLKITPTDVVIKKDNGETLLTITDPGVGVIRVPLEFTTAGVVCIQAYSTGDETLNNSSFQNNNDAGPAWNTGASPNVNHVTIGTSDTLYLDYDFIEGVAYTVSGNLTVSGGANGVIYVVIMDDSYSTLFQDGENYFGSGVENVSVSFTATSSTTKIGFRVGWASSSSTTITLNTAIVNIDLAPITEEICITVLQECDSTFIADDIRLTEDGDFRILE